MKATSSQRFIDKVKVRVQAGNGGNGFSSFHRARSLPKGGPDGGDGGRGGNVIFTATTAEQSLIALQYLNHYEADNGGHGMGKDCCGRNGEDVIINVPIGSIIKDLDADGAVLCDLDHDGQQFVAATGGKGGRGNARFSSSTNQAPRHCEEGLPGTEHYLELELKLIADVGLIGFPNAGKSTFLGAVSNATPEIASYPFTTLSPHIGVVEIEEYSRFTIADIPGLIEGAHKNIGLGHEFLRHIERTKVLLYVLDMAGTDGRTPWDDFAALQFELECYQRGMTNLPSLILANKMDAEPSAENLEILQGLTPLEILPICAVLGENCEGVKDRLWALRNEGQEGR